MSHLHDILNPESSRRHGETLSVETEPVDNLSSSAEDDISPGSDDEIDELDEESEEEDYDEPQEEPLPSPSILTAATDQYPGGQQQLLLDGRGETKADPKEDRVPTRTEDKRPQPAPRRRLEKHDRKIDLGLHDHKAHADCPDTLACLPDTHGRPQHTLPVILRCAILGSPRKRLTIREIYATMESKYPYYKTAGQTWKQSVRHHLSLNRLFERQPRPVTDPGFGSYWTVNLAAPPGTKRPRKRGRPNKDGADGSGSTKKASASKSQDSPTSHQHPGPTKFQFQPQTHPPPPPPPLPQPQVNTLSPHTTITHQPPPQPMSQPQHQSRPQQQTQPHPQINIVHKSQFQAQIIPQMQQHPPPTRQSHYQPQSQLKSPNHLHSHSHRQQEVQRLEVHHNRKTSTPMTPVSGRESYPPSSKDSEETEDVGLMTHEEDANGPTFSESEFESEEEMIPHYGRRQSLPGAFIPTRPSPIFSLPPFSALDQNRDDIIEHMRQEIATLRRTSAEAVSTSIRLSEQLANANLEVSRSREAVRDLEDMLQHEASARKEAERLRDQELERRRAAEHALTSLANRSPNNRVRPT